MEFNGIKNVKVFPTLEKTALFACQFICDFVKKNPNASIVYATGNTYLSVYQYISEKVKKGKVDFSKTRAFHLDEYYPCKPSDPFSFVGYMRKHVFTPFGIKRKNTFEIDGNTKDPEKEVARYRKLLQKYPADLIILGIGPGGHIAFNEAGSKKRSRFRLVNLSKETVQRDRVERKQKTPKKAFTWGIYDILKGKEIILTAYGSKKGEYLNKALCGKISSNCPASYLRLVGEKVNIFIDKKAAKYFH